MNIGIDLRPLVLGASGGITQLVKGVCEHMFSLYPNHKFLVFCTPFNRSLFDCDAKNVFYFSLPISAYFQELDRIAIEKEVEVLFRTYPIEDTLKFPVQKQIFLIPDNQHETFPEFFSSEILHKRRVAFNHALGGAGAIGTISEFARNALLSFPSTRCNDLFLMEPSLQTVHELRKAGGELSKSEKELLPQKDYFLFPANLWKHKNHPRLLKAFSLFLEKTGRDVALVLTGHPDGWRELSEEFPGLPVVHLGFVRPELLRVLLERARALVFFSLYEGFGMPLLEAFDAGTPVICSNTTSLPEVGGDAVLTCDPTDIEAIAGLMELVLENDKLREALVQKGKTRLNVYSWEKSAHNLVAACERVVARKQTLAQRDPEPQEWLPLVSIVTPSYNQGRFLQRTIESVLRQNYSKTEYVVIDGGSKDESSEILKSYGDRFFWVSEPDNGQTHAINKGLSRLNGEIFAYLNSDDVLLPQAIEKVVRFFQQHPECDMVYGNAFYIDENDKVIGTYKTADYSFDRLVQDCMICQPATFWRRQVTEKIGLFDESLNYAMDYDYWLRMAKNGINIRFLPETLAGSRLYPETKTLSARSSVYQEIFNTCRKHAGYIHKSYYQGYWHHLIFERTNLASRLLRLSPKIYLLLAHVHFRCAHLKRVYREKLNRKRFIGFAYKRLVYYSRGSKLLRKLLIASVKLAEKDRAPVTGFLPDNWLEPEVFITPRQKSAGHYLHLGGIAPIDLTMLVYAGKEEVGQFNFSAHQYQRIQFSSDLISNKPILVRFSDFVIDDHNRRLAFLLQDTNIFSEQDACS